MLNLLIRDLIEEVGRVLLELEPDGVARLEPMPDPHCRSSRHHGPVRD